MAEAQFRCYFINVYFISSNKSDQVHFSGYDISRFNWKEFRSVQYLSMTGYYYLAAGLTFQIYHLPARQTGPISISEYLILLCVRRKTEINKNPHLSTYVTSSVSCAQYLSSNRSHTSETLPAVLALLLGFLTT